MKKTIQQLVLILLIFTGLQSFTQNNDKELVSFGGHAFTYDFPIEHGLARLYNSDKIIIDTSIIDTLGYYYFYKKPAGIYYIEALLDLNDPNFQDFYPTVYPDYSDLAFAEPIEIKEDNWELDIIMFYANGNNESGPGKINGSLSIGNGKYDIEGIDVQVHKSGQPVRHTQTDSFGNFEIDDLPYGSYILYPQILGFSTIPYHFEISELSTSYENVQLTIENGQISSYINEAIVNNNSFICFPNPANHILNISFDFDGTQQIQTRVLDITGRIILDKTDRSINTYNNQFNTSDWENGYYFIEVFLDGIKAVSQKVAIAH